MGSKHDHTRAESEQTSEHRFQLGDHVSIPEQEALFWQFAGVCRLVYKTCA
jgi:hypothetical protein